MSIIWGDCKLPCHNYLGFAEDEVLIAVFDSGTLMNINLLCMETLVMRGSWLLNDGVCNVA